MFVKMVESGVPVSEIARKSVLSDEEIDRIIWWHRAVRGEFNGGWL